MKGGFVLSQKQNLEEIKDPHLGKAITGGRREAPTEEMNIAEMNGLITGLMTTTKMILERKDITPTKANPKTICNRPPTQ